MLEEGAETDSKAVRAFGPGNNWAIADAQVEVDWSAGISIPIDEIESPKDLVEKIIKPILGIFNSSLRNPAFSDR
jgi:hypothetical protein